MSEEARGTIVVTGASTGIGAACVQDLDERGFRVFATVRKQADAERYGAYLERRYGSFSLFRREEIFSPGQ